MMRGWKGWFRSLTLWFSLLAVGLILALMTGLTGYYPRAFPAFSTEELARSKWLPRRASYHFTMSEQLEDWNCSVSRILQTLESYDDLGNLHHCQRIFYNRVPKCGSRTLLNLFKVLGTSNDYNVEVAPMPHDIVKDYSWEFGFVKNFTKLRSPYIYSQHIHFINFSRFNSPPPIYINVIRDPVERLISHYSFNQFGSKGAPLLTPKPNFQMSLDECVSKRRSACLGQIQKILPYFCGLNKKCRHGVRNQDRLAQVKRTLRENYLVVGITEDLPAFVEVLEELLPQFFSNATQVFLQIESDLQNSTRTALKPRIKEETRALLKDILSLDYELYEYAKQRFYALLDKVRSLRQKEARVKAKQNDINKNWDTVYDQT